MQKYLILISSLFILVGCNIRSTTNTTICSYREDNSLENTFVINANKNEVTFISETLTITRDSKIPIPEFMNKSKLLSSAIQLQNETLIETAGGQIPGYELTIESDDNHFKYIKTQDFSKIDFGLMNEINFYTGYDREVKGLYLDEEINALENNGFLCEIQK